jgi:hypothetical protein
MFPLILTPGPERNLPIYKGTGANCSRAPKETHTKEAGMTQPTTDVAPVQTVQTEMDAAKIQSFQRRMRDEQDLARGAFAGFGAALLGACAWALITVLTGYQIGWMAIGVGFLVGYSVKTFGRGVDTVFGITGALFALLGCALGNLLSVAIVVASEAQVSTTFILSNLDFQAAKELMTATFNPMDLLFYGLALYEGYRFSFRKLSESEVRSLMS